MRNSLPKHTSNHKETQAQRCARITRIMWRAAGIIIACVVLLFVLIYNGVIGYMPPIEELKNPTDKYASIIYSSDGVEMGRYYRSKGNRVYVEFNDMSKYLTEALVATEDVRFEQHSGIDPRALARSVVKRIILGKRNAGGGSTITQQLAKQLYSPTTKNIFVRALQKPIEWMIAVKLERYYTKDEIIKMYFNQFDFLNNAVGIKSAAYVYFGKTPKDLNLQESAMLVGMVKNPSYYNPRRDSVRCKDRRNVVLDQMVKANMLTQAQCNEVKQTPLGVSFHKIDHNDGLAPYFREELRRILTAKKPERKNYPSWNQQAFIDDSIAWETSPQFGWCEKTHHDIYQEGLRIYTTIDSRMQKYAENAVQQHMTQLEAKFLAELKVRGNKDPYTTNPDELPYARKRQLIINAIRQSERYRALKASGMNDEEIMANFRQKTTVRLFSYDRGIYETEMTPFDSLLYMKSYLRCGMMSMDPITGYIKAYVGGPDFRMLKYDMVATGRRQIGSTVKPFLYSLAMENSYTPCDRLLNTPPTINGWTPRNAGHGRIGQSVDLTWALTWSNNWISARMFVQALPPVGFGLSPQQLVKLMHSFGITNKLDAVPSLCLGPCEVSLWEMVSAYSTFADGGMRVDPLMVTRICDNHGNIIAEFSPRQTQVISEESCYKMVSMLMNVVDGGTSRRLRTVYGLKAEMGGKTGTTNFNADGWFMGFTPELITGVWVGGEERYIHFATMANGQGAEMALPIYGLFLQQVYKDRTLPYDENAKFAFPDGFNPCNDGLSGWGKHHASHANGTDSTASDNSSPVVEGIFD